MRSCAIAIVLVVMMSAQVNAVEPEKEPSWWEKREKMEDIYFPHKKHMEMLKGENDPCMRCHPFSENNVQDESLLKKLDVIANEPMKGICHKCHVDELYGGTECRLCHKNPSTIWPKDHGFDYINNHGGAAKDGEDACAECHISVNFCTDCHFRRDPANRNLHKIGYRSRHGLEARIYSGNCGKCHSGTYCKDCHKGFNQ